MEWDEMGAPPESFSETFGFKQLLSRVRSSQFNWTLVCQWVAELQTFGQRKKLRLELLLLLLSHQCSNFLRMQLYAPSALLGSGWLWGDGGAVFSGSGQAQQVSREMSRVHDLWPRFLGKRPAVPPAKCRTSYGPRQSATLNFLQLSKWFTKYL